MTTIILRISVEDLAKLRKAMNIEPELEAGEIKDLNDGSKLIAINLQGPKLDSLKFYLSVTMKIPLQLLFS